MRGDRRRSTGSHRDIVVTRDGVAWLTRVVEQCQATAVPVWVKQDGAFKDGQQGCIPDAVWVIKQLPQGL